MLNIPVRIRSNGLIGILVSVQLVPIAGPPQLGLNDKGVLVEAGSKQQGLQAFGVIALRDGFAVGPLGDMQPLDPAEVQQVLDEAGTDELPSATPDNMTGRPSNEPSPNVEPASRSRGTVPNFERGARKSGEPPDDTFERMIDE